MILREDVVGRERVTTVEHSDSRINNSIRFTLTNRFFDSIQQFDKTDACTLTVSHTYGLIITNDYFLIVCIIDFFVKF